MCATTPGFLGSLRKKWQHMYSLSSWCSDFYNSSMNNSQSKILSIFHMEIRYYYVVEFRKAVGLAVHFGTGAA